MGSSVTKENMQSAGAADAAADEMPGTFKKMDDNSMAQPSDITVTTEEDGPNKSTTVDSKAEKMDSGDGEGDRNDADCTASETHGHPPPVWLCKMIARHPRKAFATFLGMHIGAVVLLGILMVAGYDAVPVNFKDAPFNIYDAWEHLRVMAWINRDEDTGGIDILPNVLDNKDINERTLKDEAYVVYYDGGKNNAFTKENLQAINETEERIMRSKDYKNFCYAYQDGTCVPPVSIIRFFDGTFKEIDPIFQPNPDFEDIPLVLSTALHDQYSLTKEALQFHLGKDSIINKTMAESTVTRSLFRIGFPLEGYVDAKDHEDDQEEERYEFFNGELTDTLIDIAEDGAGNMDFLYNSMSLLQSALDRTLIRDQILAMGSMVFIFIFMAFQTRSLFITVFAVMSIQTSFAATNLVYRIIFDFRYFGIFHVLSIFIILGLGADNVFIFYDMWRHTSFKKYPALEYRLSDCYRRSAASMLITSLTTMVAFFANALSPMLMVNSFGLFSGLVIFINYLSSITYIPCVVVIYHIYFEKWQWPCFRCCSKSTDSGPPTAAAAATTTSSKDTMMTIDITDSDKKGNGVFKWDPETQTVADRVNARGETPNVVVRFFAGPYYRFITHKVIRWIIVLVNLGLMAFFFYSASKLTPDEEPIKIFKSDHNFNKAQDMSLKAFKPSAEDFNVRVYISWGLKKQDRSDCHHTDFNCDGNTVWDESFDLNPPPAQLALLEFCHTLQNMDEENINKLRLRKNVDGKVEIKCFIENMQNYLAQAMSDLNITDDFELPTTAAKIQPLMEARDDIYDPSVLSDRYYRYFEVAMDYWLADGFKSRTYDYDEFYELIGMTEDPDTHSMDINGTDYLYGTRLMYAAVVVNITLEHRSIGYEDGKPLKNAWEDFVNNATENMPPSLSGGFQFTPELLAPDEWQLFKIQEVLVRSAWQGIGIGLAFGLPIMIIATKNWILGLMATMNVTIVTFTVMGMIHVLGWKLGSLESLNMSLIVGLAIDYVVHLVVAYRFSKKHTRLGKTHDMLSEVGVSVVSGACTTLGASFFMLFTVLMFFTQFGIFMFCTIGFSLFYSLGLFSTVIAIMGPEGDTGSIMPLYYCIKRCIVGRKKTDVDCQECEGKGFHSQEKAARSGKV